MSETSGPTAQFLSGGGTTGALLRAYDWSTTPLGRPHTWPQPLQTAVSLMLGAAQPVYIAWGAALTSLYNDGYLPIVGTKHPGIGLPFATLWAEIWDEFRPLVKKTLAGEAQHFIDRPIALAGRPGQPIGYFTFSYTPLRDMGGSVAGFYCAATETTANVLAQIALRANEARFHGVLDGMAEGFGLLAPDFTILELNAEALRLETRPRGAIIGLSHWQAYPGSERSEVGHLYKQAMAERVPVALEHHYTWPDGRGAWLDMRAYPTSDGGLAIFYREVTKRKAAEEVLRDTEERLRLAVDNAEIGFWDVDEVNDSLIWPPRTKALFGISPDVPVTMRDFYNGLHPEDRAATADAYAAAADPSRRALYDVEYRTVGKEDGVVRWVAAKGRGVFDEGGRCLRVAGTAVDITARKASEAALRASEVRFAAIANSVDQMVWTTLPDGFHDYYNDRWYEFTGVSKGSTDGEGWIGLFHVDDHDRAWTKWRHSLASGEPYHIEYRLRHRSGQYRWVIGRAQCVRDETGRITRWYGTCTDIHDIVEAREVLARSRAELEQLIDERTAERDRMWESSRDLMLVIGFDGVFRRVNPAWTTLLGYTADELVGHHVNDFVLPEDHDITVGAYLEAAAGGRPTIENRYRHKDGSTRWIAWMAAPAGDMTYATGRDMTAARERQAELEAAQEALRQSQKMEAVGQLTGGIAHDFNNMLAVVMGSLDLLGRRIDPSDSRARRYVDAAVNGGKRAALLTQRLLAFSRQQPLRPETVDANNLVAGMSDLLRHSLGGMVELETVLAGGLWRVHADPNQLEHVILNLAVNARDAMPNGGKLTVETQNTHLDANYAADHLGISAGQYVLIAVTDTGTGMAKEVIAKAFDPFFTTKEVGKGTGLGLSQVYGFVKQSHGHVKIYSELGQGTTFKVYLPRHLGPADEEHNVSPAQELPLGELQEVVLVVEDEPWVRQFSVDALLELGYRVIEADGASSALRLLDAHPEIALMFTDIVMPGVNGARLAEEARRRRPDLRVLFTTGYTRNAVVHNGVVDPGVELIGKPFTIEELAARVRQILDASAN